VVLRASVKGKVVGGGPKDGQLLCNNSPVSLRISVTMTFIVHRQTTKAGTRTAPVFQLPMLKAPRLHHVIALSCAYTCTSRMHGIIVLVALFVNPLDKSWRKW